MANPNGLYLLADHIKLSLLERQRSKALNLLQDDSNKKKTNKSTDEDAAGTGADAQDGHLARALDQLRDGIDGLEREQARLEADGEEGKALHIGDALPGLQKKLAELTAQFQGMAPVATSTSTPTASASTSQPGKAVRFQDKPLPPPGRDDDDDIDLEAQRSSLFRRPYTDDPDQDRDRDQDYADQDNVQLHQMHARIIDEQDAQLDALGASISRQRELSMQIGDELDSQVAMLEESERVVDRHQTRLDRARKQVGKISRSAGDCKQMVAIVVLIVILVLLIAILK